MWDLSSLTRDWTKSPTLQGRFFFFFFFNIYLFGCWVFIVAFKLSAVACGIQFPDQGLNLSPQHWEFRVLATGPPESPIDFFLCVFLEFYWAYSNHGLQYEPLNPHIVPLPHSLPSFCHSNYPMSDPLPVSFMSLMLLYLYLFHSGVSVWPIFQFINPSISSVKSASEPIH